MGGFNLVKWGLKLCLECLTLCGCLRQGGLITVILPHKCQSQHTEGGTLLSGTLAQADKQHREHRSVFGSHMFHLLPEGGAFLGEQTVRRMSERLTLLRKTTKAAGTSRLVSYFKYPHFNFQLTTLLTPRFVTGEGGEVPLCHVCISYPQNMSFLTVYILSRREIFSKRLPGKRLIVLPLFGVPQIGHYKAVFISLAQAMPFNPSLNETLLLSPCLNLISDSFLTKLCFSPLLPLRRCHCPHNELCL